MGKVWDSEYENVPVPFKGMGLTFMMSGTDFMYSAGMLSKLTGDKEPLVWAKRLGKRYVDARDPNTGLGASNFTTYNPDERMKRQFPQFKGKFTEASVTDLYGARYSHCAISQLKLGEKLGEDGKEFLQWGLEDLTARAKNGYDANDNRYYAMLIDGTRLGPKDIEIKGYVTERWLSKEG